MLRMKRSGVVEPQIRKHDSDALIIQYRNNNFNEANLSNSCATEINA